MIWPGEGGGYSGSGGSITTGTWAPYVSTSDVMDRLLISDGDEQYEASIENAIGEACNYVAAAHCPFVSTLPLENVTAFMVNYTADIAAGIFKKRLEPGNMDIGWWAQGIEKLRLDIDSTYLYGVEFTWNTNDPEEIMGALDKKVINIKEARTLLEGCTLDPTSENISYVEAQINLINAQITKLGKDGLLVDAQELLTDAQKLKVDAETDVLEADLTRMAADLTKITAEKLVLAQQVLNLQADVTHLTALNGNLTAINNKLGAETTKIGGADTNLEVAQTTLIYAQKDLVNNEILTSSSILAGGTVNWYPKDFEEARDIITASISKLTQTQIIEILRAVPRQKGFSYLSPPSEE